MKAMILIILVAILIMLCNIRISMEKWGNELVLTKVTEVNNNHYYDIEHYGTISISDN